MRQKTSPAGFKEQGFDSMALRAALTNNRARLGELRSQAGSAMMAVFDIIPDILNGRPLGPPEYLAGGRTPTGLRFWGSPLEAAEARGRPPALESLMLMGSSGSIGHTARSDLDYWLCYNPESISAPDLALFRRRLNLLTAWAAREYKAEVNFYLVDLVSMAQGEMIGPSCPDDSEGQVAPLLLLEEFYRTTLHVGGRAPLWWGVPAGIMPREYGRLAADLRRTAPFLVDLGFPAVPEPQEYLAAALWLARKSEADPFKGGIKLMTILEQVETVFNSPLLCNQVKERILLTPPEQLPVDPYLLTVNNVLAYGRQRLRPAQLELLRISVFFKVRGLGRPGQVIRLGPLSTKYKVLTELVAAWGWDDDQVNRLLDYENWPERAQLDLGERLQELSNDLYGYISHRLEADYPGRIDAQRGRLNQLAARLLTRQKGYDATVETLPSQLHRSLISPNLRLAQGPDGWGIYAAGPGGANLQGPDNLIYHSNRAARAAAWLVNNRLNDWGLEVPEGAVPENVFTRLVNEIAQLWPPVRWADLNQDSLWRPEVLGPRLIVVNLENHSRDGQLNEIDFIFRIGWGEMRHLWLDLRQESLEADKYKLVAELVARAGGEPDPDSLRIFFAKNFPGQGKAYSNLTAAVTMTLAKNTRPWLGCAPQNGIRPDLT